METFLTRAITIVALTCFLVVGAAATAILGRDSVPAAQFGSRLRVRAAVQGPVSNRESKKDKLAVVAYALAAYEPQQAPGAERAVASGLCVHRARRYRHAEGIAPADTPAARRRRRSQRPPPSPPPQKNYALLSDIQIAGIKERLKLSASQESYWPPVETALRAVARKIHAGRQADPSAPARRSIRTLRKSSS